MKILTNKMASILERLAEMFPGSNYQTRLESYLKCKGVTDAAQLEHYLKEFESKERQLYL